ncbi:hypothetical protein NDU88_006631 [Pleurodeles waltl]|uniref:Uncharacterized protein n=1 Tax=Pleurodeles waltl TaxID=8319 RepID=A0AAV7VPM8_PLEWA|nr:hypothetical protein NDU88_006631 [Pleurodeles waltl]
MLRELTLRAAAAGICVVTPWPPRPFTPPVLHPVLSGFVRAVEGLRSPLPGAAGAAPEVRLHSVACQDLPRSAPSQRPALRVTARLSDLTTLHPRPRTYLPLTYSTLVSSTGVCGEILYRLSRGKSRGPEQTRAETSALTLSAVVPGRRMNRSL